jgi:uncharacterized phage protein (TIGR01671 family)
MREIKFKVWNPRLKEMSEPFTLMELISADVNLLHKSNYDEPIEWLQFTGLKDKQFKEIYEGDILKSNIGNIGFVRHSNSVCWHITYNLKLNTGLKNPPDENLLTQLWDSYDRWEVIGNIYENPELLEEVA